MEQRRWLLLALALLPAIPLSENFELTSPENVLGIVDQDTILPCTISSTKPLVNPEVQWIKITDGHTEDVYTYRQFGGEPMQKYSGRASVPKDGFATGNVSLTLKNVQPADEGLYSCFVTSRDWGADTDTKLTIAGTGELFAEVLGPQGQGLELGCRSHRWFPKPTVQWVTEDGQGLSPDTDIQQDSSKLFIVWSRVTVTGEQVGKVTCQILNPLLQVEKKTTVLISDAAFSCMPPFVPAFWTVLTLFLLTLVAVAVLVFQGKNNQISWISCRGKRETPSHAARTEEANTTEALESMLQNNHQQLSQQIKTLQEPFQNMEASTLCDLQNTTGDLKNELERTEEANTTEALESMLQNNHQQLSQQIKTLQEAFQNMQESTLRELQLLRADLKNEQDPSELRSYKGSSKIPATLK